MFTRRVFLKSSGLAVFGIGATPAWLARAAFAADTAGRRRKILVAIFQRGAADGLNIVVPFGEKRYYDLRPTIAIPAPSGPAGDAAVDLDGFFGLHPSLKPLKQFWDAKRLAVVHATGSPDPTRSHFDAQDFMESGTPGLKSTHDGWLNRALPDAAETRSPVRAIATGPSLPRSLRGRNAAVAVGNLTDFQVRDPSFASAFETMYSSTTDTVLHTTGEETFEAVRILKAIQSQPYSPAGGARYPAGRFGQSLQQIARLIKGDVGLEVAFADIGGWDHHVNEVGQRASQGPLANLLADFGQSLAAFAQDLGDGLEDVVLVTMSEFGRTARENGNRGTDHGHANVMLVLGGSVRGGKVYGDWPGLANEQLYEGRDLNLTTDFRGVLGEVIQGHLGRMDWERVFPGYEAGTQKFRGFLA